MRGWGVLLRAEEDPLVVGREGLAIGLYGGSGLDGANSLPVDLASSVAFSLNDTVGLRVGGSTIFPFPFMDAHAGDGCSTTSSLR